MGTNSDRAVGIRPAYERDVPELSRLRLEALRTEPSAFSSEYDAARNNSREEWLSWFRERGEGPNRVIFLAQVDDRLAGMAGIARGDTAKIRHGGFLWGVFVRQDARGRRIGWRLTEACLRWASEKGIEIVRLEVNSANVAAIRLYASFGFQVCGMTPKGVRVDGMDYDALAMVRELQTD